MAESESGSDDHTDERKPGGSFPGSARGGERIPEAGILVIFGASGDLTKRKLLPALFHLEQAGLLPKKFAIVGVARRPLGDEFAADMRAGILCVWRRGCERPQTGLLCE